MSECRESNPGYIHPMDAYCRYTTLRTPYESTAELIEAQTNLSTPTILIV